MAVTANIQFTQGATTAAPGTSVIGAAGSVVSLSNGDNTNVNYWSWQLLDKPSGSALTIGPISEGPASSVTSFTPDVAGCYRILLTVKDVSNNTVQQIRNFGIRNSRGWLQPSYKSGALEMNFGGNTRGGAVYTDEIFADLKTNADASSGATVGGLVARGAYASGTAYVRNDYVTLAGVAYRALAPTTGNAPPNVTYWEQYSAPGIVISGTPLLGQSVTHDGTVYKPMVVQSPNAINVFGAVGDGSTSNHVVVPTGAAVVGSSGGIFFPPGVYNFTTSCTIDCRVIFAAGAKFTAPDGVVVTISHITAGTSQEIFGQTGQFIIGGIHTIYPEWFGAKTVPQGSTFASGYDNKNAFLACIRSSAAPTSSHVYGTASPRHIIQFKAGVYRCNAPLVFNTTGSVIRGAGPNATYIMSDDGSMPLFIFQTAQGSLPVVPAPFGQPGNAWNASYSQSYNDPTTHVGITATTLFNSLMPAMECEAIFTHEMEAWTQIEVSEFFKIPLGGSLTFNTITVGASYSITIAGTTFAYTLLAGQTIVDLCNKLSGLINSARPAGLANVGTSATNTLEFVFADAALTVVNNSTGVMTYTNGLPIPASGCSVFSFLSHLGASDLGSNCLNVSLTSAGKLHVEFPTRNDTTSAGDYLTGDHPIGILTPGKWYYWCVSWNGTTSRFEVGLAGTDNPTNLTTTSMVKTQNGSLAIDRWSTMSLGALQREVGGAGTGAQASFGFHYNWKIKNGGVRTAAFIPPSAAEACTSVTQCLTNFETWGPSGEAVFLYSRGATTPNGATPVRQGDHGVYAHFTGAMSLSNVTLNGGIYINDCVHSEWTNVMVQGGGYALCMNNSYSNRMDTIVASNTLNSIIINNGGINEMSNCQATSSVCFGFVLKDTSIVISNPYILSSKIGIYSTSAGAEHSVTILGGALSDEGVTDHHTSIYMDGANQEFICRGLTIQNENSGYAGNYGTAPGGYTLNYRGVYDDLATYAFNDTVRLVANDPYLYRAMATVSGVVPDADAVLWEQKIRRHQIYIGSPNIKFSANNCYFDNSSNLGCMIRFADTCNSTNFGRVDSAVLSAFASPVVPWTNRPDLFGGAPSGYELASKGFSSSLVPCHNHTGVATIVGASTTATVSFPVAEVDANFVITSLAVTVRSGSPAANSLKEAPYASARTTGGFVINLSTAPGTSADAIDVGWTISRALTGPSPVITAVPTSHGVVSSSLTLAGSNIQSGAAVLFNGVAGVVTSTTPPSSITATAPTLTAATYPSIQIVNPDGPGSRLKYGFTYDEALPAGFSGLSGIIAHLRGDTGVLMSGSNVELMSGYAATATAVFGKRPTLKTGGAGVGGQSAISTDGTTQYMKADIPLITGNMSLFMVFKYTGFPTAAFNVYSAAEGGTGFWQNSGFSFTPYNATVNYGGVGAVASGTSAGAGNVNVVLIKMSTAGCQIRVNGVTGTLAGPSFSANAAKIMIGALFTGSTSPEANSLGQIDFAECLILDHVASTGDITALDSYAFGRYGVHL
jgi:hypothetical protein